MINQNYYKGFNTTKKIKIVQKLMKHIKKNEHDGRSLFLFFY